MSISTGSEAQGALVVCTGSELEIAEAESEYWSFLILILRGVVLVIYIYSVSDDFLKDVILVYDLASGAIW